jgi:hypothetical protein
LGTIPQAELRWLATGRKFLEKPNTQYLCHLESARKQPMQRLRKQEHGNYDGKSGKRQQPDSFSSNSQPGSPGATQGSSGNLSAEANISGGGARD